MAKIEHSNIDYILKWEGGLSKHKADTASKHPVPDGSGFHTNKGITWMVWRTIHGSTSESIARFYKMTHTDFLSVYQRYWDGVNATAINSQIIAEFWADFAWGSGIGGASRQMQRFLNSHGFNLKVDGKIGQQTINALNSLISQKSEKWVFESCYAWRVSFLQSLTSFKDFGKGWLNRMQDFYLYANRELMK
jgi:lysozyme family protein